MHVVPQLGIGGFGMYLMYRLLKIIVVGELREIKQDIKKIEEKL